MPLTEAERKLRATAAAYARWAGTPDPEGRRKATEPGRRAALDYWNTKADPECILTPEVRRKRAEALRLQHMAAIALASSKARRAKRASAAGISTATTSSRSNGKAKAS